MRVKLKMSTDMEMFENGVNSELIYLQVAFEIVDIKYTVHFDPVANEGDGQDVFTALIMYKPKQ